MCSNPGNAIDAVNISSHYAKIEPKSPQSTMQPPNEQITFSYNNKAKVAGSK